MSIRTIVEINNDYLETLGDEELMEELRYTLQGSLNVSEGDLLVPGIRFLRQRHHSETVTIEVK